MPQSSEYLDVISFRRGIKQVIALIACCADEVMRWGYAAAVSQRTGVAIERVLKMIETARREKWEYNGVAAKVAETPKEEARIGDPNPAIGTVSDLRRLEAVLGKEAAWYAWIIPQAKAKVVEWNRQDEYDEICGKLSDTDEEWIEWKAFEILKRRMEAEAPILSDEERIARYGKSEDDLEAEEVEITLSFDAVLDQWAEMITNLSAVDDPIRQRELTQKAIDLAREEMRFPSMARPYIAEIAGPALQRLQALEKEAANGDGD